MSKSGRNEGARMMGGIIGLAGRRKIVPHVEERKFDVRKCDENPGKWTNEPERGELGSMCNGLCRVWVGAGIDRGSGLDKMIFETATKNIREFASPARCDQCLNKR